MNISTEIELGLKRLCNPALINDKCFQILLKKAEKRLGTLLNSDTADQLTDDGENLIAILMLIFVFRVQPLSIKIFFLNNSKLCKDQNYLLLS